MVEVLERIPMAKLIAMLIVAALGCGQGGSDGAGGAGGGGSESAGAAPSTCAEIGEESACTAAGCDWRDAYVFQGPTFVCSAATQGFACANDTTGVIFDTIQYWRRVAGDTIVVIPAASNETLDGYERCGISCAGTDECSYCECVDGS